MGESLLKRLLGGFGGKSAEAVVLDNRLRLVTHGPAETAESATQAAALELPPDAPAADSLQFVTPLPAAPVIEDGEALLVDIKGFVMSRHAALESEGIARGSSDCVEATHTSAGDVGYKLTVTLAMKPDPRRIDEAVEAMQAICSQLGGRAEGFALRQQQIAA